MLDTGLGVRTVAGGAPCDLVTVPARQGLEAVDILRAAGRARPGPADDGAGDTLGFLVPPGTAACWDMPGSACTQTPGAATHPSRRSRRLSAQRLAAAAGGGRGGHRRRRCCGRRWARRPA